ncbi:MAG: DUF4023 domain-containing protein [Bacillus sp. (in: firmicutes)]
MDSTHEFVGKIKEQQQKEKKNLKTQGNGHPDSKLPNVKHRKR